MQRCRHCILHGAVYDLMCPEYPPLPSPPPDRWLEVWLRMRYHYKSNQFQDVSNVVFIVAGRSVISEVSDWWMWNRCDVLLNLSAIGKLTWSLSYFTLMWQLKYVNCHSSILKLRCWIVSITVWALSTWISQVLRIFQNSNLVQLTDWWDPVFQQSS